MCRASAPEVSFLRARRVCPQPVRGWASTNDACRSLKPERPLRFHVLFFDRMQPMPERKPTRDDQSNGNADQKKPAISRQRDQQNRAHNARDKNPRRSPQAESRAAARFRLHDFILAPLWVV